MEKLYSQEIKIENKEIGSNHPTYFIADIAANHDGYLERAKDLIYLAAESGADAAKFQHFDASTIVSDFGFRSLGGHLSHQAQWEKSVFEVYQDASLNPDWPPILSETCKLAGITFMTSPYSFELVDLVEPYVSSYKIGSGDITWLQLIEHIVKKKKPVLLATGASTMDDVVRAVDAIGACNRDIVLMQCNTNYTAKPENFSYLNLNVLKQFALMYPGMVLGFSDHTFGHSSVLGAVALGAKVIEKHFTDDNDRQGPDHKFAMNSENWREMVNRTRELEFALGRGIKKVEENEKETVVLQRRSIRAKYQLKLGNIINFENTEALRPCPEYAITPDQWDAIIGKTVVNDIEAGDTIRWSDLK